MDVKTGDKIKIFPSTDVQLYMDHIKYVEGYNVKRQGNYLVVGEPSKHGGLIQYGNQIRQARRAIGMKRKELAEKCGVSTDTVYKWEMGFRTPRNWRKVQAILGIGVEKVKEFKK